MELFPAADDDSLTLIRNVIDDSDYYLVILGGRYGTLNAPGGKSYTHLEYEYALASGKPTIALLHSNPGVLSAERTERTDEGRRHFEEFAVELRKKNCRTWRDRGELIAAVFTGVQHLKKTRPGVGWTKSRATGDETLKDELLRVRREVDALNLELVDAKSRTAPQGTEELAQGTDRTTIVVDFSEGGRATYACAWQDIIRSILPQTFGAGAEEKHIAGALASVAQVDGFRREASPSNCWGDETVSRSSYGTVMNQMVALGLIEARSNLLSPTATVWFATPYGVREGSRLVAVKKAESIRF
jgi:hypothetical protein